MKVYIAGRVSRGGGEIAGLANRLEARGHEITLKWWNETPKKPFLDNKQQSQVLAKKMEQAIKKSDVLILFAEESILGAAIEFGIALGDASKKHKILLIYPPSARQSIFYTHPSVSIVRGVDDINLDKLE